MRYDFSRSDGPQAGGQQGPGPWRKCRLVEALCVGLEGSRHHIQQSENKSDIPWLTRLWEVLSIHHPSSVLTPALTQETRNDVPSHRARGVVARGPLSRGGAFASFQPMDTFLPHPREQRHMEVTRLALRQHFNHKDRAFQSILAWEEDICWSQEQLAKYDDRWSLSWPPHTQ